MLACERRASKRIPEAFLSLQKKIKIRKYGQKVLWRGGEGGRGKRVKSSECLYRNAQLSFYEEAVSPCKHLPDKRWCLRGSSSVMKTHHPWQPHMFSRHEETNKPPSAPSLYLLLPPAAVVTSISGKPHSTWLRSAPSCFAVLAVTCSARGQTREGGCATYHRLPKMYAQYEHLLEILKLRICRLGFSLHSAWLPKADFHIAQTHTSKSWLIWARFFSLYSATPGRRTPTQWDF